VKYSLIFVGLLVIIALAVQSARTAAPVAAPSNAPAAAPTAAPTAAVATNGKNPMVYVRIIDAEGKLAPPAVVPKVVKTDEEWKKQLTPEQFRITRGKGTERAFCGGLLKNKEAGMYVCIACNLPLFQSDAKFESHTGWPSFFQPVADENVAKLPDNSYGMQRTEINCARCDSHLGHLFDDGPAPTGLRFCLNSESLRFVPNDQLKTLAENPPKIETAEIVLGGGCFWCVEAVFEELDGVIDAVSGYAGGDASTANYEAVSTGRTGHAEAVKIVYDPKKIPLEKILKVHFATHDPTTLNRQGHDVGTQYRSAIFYANEQEKKLAEAFIADLGDAKAFKSPIVTTLEPLKAFYPAETHHQNYVCNNPNQGYVRGVALPKVEKVREKFKDMLKPASAATAGQ
jgi:peptide methionine sulfoxide reductase msrA/msrB